MNPATVEVSCAFCHGVGLDPYQVMSALSRCCVCGGSGTVRVRTPFVPCAHCQGTGSVKTLTCTVCKGKGVIPALVGPTQVCPTCGGTGDEHSAPALECLSCHGRGRVSA